MPTPVLGCVRAPRWVVLPQPFHYVLDPPDLLLNLPIEHLILKQQRVTRGCASPARGLDLSEQALEPLSSCLHTPLQHT